MIPADLILTFIVASTLLALAPGPDNIFVLAQSATNGRLTGLIITLGLCTGLAFHTAAVALGVAALFEQSALAFTALKILGALYLVYLAWTSFRAAAGKIVLQAAKSPRFAALYRRGVIMNIANPKVSVFFLAFLPQFASLERGALIPQFILLGLVFIAVALVVFSAIALLAGWIGEALTRSPKMQKILHNVAGAVFLGLAVNLALAER